MAERLWCVLCAVVLALAAGWGAHPVSPDVPWEAVRVVMFAAAAFATLGVASPHTWSKARTAVVGFAFLARAAIVSVGVVGFPNWQSTAIAASTYAALGIATVMLAAAWEAARGID